MTHARELYFFGPVHVATARTLLLRERGVPAIWHRNTCFFCPECGETWARRVFADLPPLQGWNVELRYCARHGDGTMLLRSQDVLDLINPSASFLTHELLSWNSRHEYNHFRRCPNPGYGLE